MENYKIEHPPLSSAEGLHWEDIDLSETDAAPLVAAGIISKKIPAVAEVEPPETEEPKSTAKLPKK
jgi:hypothetical protein